MQAETLTGGFARPAQDAADAFRSIMTVMARPGQITTVTGGQGPAPLSPAAATILLTLCDPETPLYLAGGFDTADIRQWIAFHTGAPLVQAAKAQFALGRWEDLAPHDAYAIGTPEYPDRSATLIVETDELSANGNRLTGPGIKTEARLPVPDALFHQRNARLFPLGLDLFFTCGDRVAALPRTTRVS